MLSQYSGQSHSLRVAKFFLGEQFCVSKKSSIEKIFLHRRGISKFSVGFDLSHSTPNFRRGSLRCFQNFLVSKSFVDMRGGYHKFPLKVLVSEIRNLS